MDRIITAASVDAAKRNPARQKDIPDAKVPGLALRVALSGNKSWTFRYRNIAGDQKRVSLGKYPAVKLVAARDAAYRLLAAIADGGDPAATKKVEKAKARAGQLQTVGHLIERYLADAASGRHKPNGRPKRAGTMKLDRYYFDRLVKPKFGDLPLHELARADVQAFLDDVGKFGASNARHCRNVIRQAYNYAIRREITDKNPATFAELPRLVSRERVLTDGEVKAIWTAARNPAEFKGISMSPSTGLAICLTAATLQRGGEVCGIHTREIDREARTWIIPGDRTKNHKTHVVPLSDLAIEILDLVFSFAGGWSGFVFPSAQNGGGHLTRPAMDRAMKRLTSKVKVADATPHDLRRTGATAITSERIGYSRFIVSRVLNQISDTGGAGAVTGVYDRNEYLPEKRKALDAWAALLTEIVSDRVSAIR
jgi:integrase